MMMKEEEIKEHLMSANPEFRRLVEEHKLYEGQLHELHNRHHMTEQDHVEEIRLKKKKLHLKDHRGIPAARDEGEGAGCVRMTYEN